MPPMSKPPSNAHKRITGMTLTNTPTKGKAPTGLTPFSRYLVTNIAGTYASGIAIKQVIADQNATAPKSPLEIDSP